MNITYQIVKRNMYNYFYDKTTIFFSLLSVLLLVLVYTLFLGRLQVDNIIDLVGEIDGIDGMVNSWLIAGLVVTSSVTVPMATMSDIVSDREQKVFQDFYVAPIPRYSIVLAYVISAIIIGFLMASITFILGFLYLGISSSIWLPLSAFIVMFVLILLSVTLFSAFSFVVLSFVKTTSAAGTINTLIGTLIGFFAGIYVPFGAFSKSFQNVMQLNPAAQIVSLMRQVLTTPYLDIVFLGAPPNYRLDYERVYGIQIELFDMQLSSFMIGLFGLLWTLLFLVIGILRLKAYKAS